MDREEVKCWISFFIHGPNLVFQLLKIILIFGISGSILVSQEEGWRYIGVLIFCPSVRGKRVRRGVTAQILARPRWWGTGGPPPQCTQNKKKKEKKAFSGCSECLGFMNSKMLSPDLVSMYIASNACRWTVPIFLNKILKLVFDIWIDLLGWEADSPERLTVS